MRLYRWLIFAGTVTNISITTDIVICTNWYIIILQLSKTIATYVCTYKQLVLDSCPEIIQQSLPKQLPTSTISAYLLICHAVLFLRFLIDVSTYVHIIFYRYMLLNHIHWLMLHFLYNTYIVALGYLMHIDFKT